jgi:hypothetical protein
MITHTRWPHLPAALLSCRWTVLFVARHPAIGHRASQPAKLTHALPDPRLVYTPRFAPCRHCSGGSPPKPVGATRPRFARRCAVGTVRARAACRDAHISVEQQSVFGCCIAGGAKLARTRPRAPTATGQAPCAQPPAALGGHSRVQPERYRSPGPSTGAKAAVCLRRRRAPERGAPGSWPGASSAQCAHSPGAPHRRSRAGSKRRRPRRGGAGPLSPPSLPPPRRARPGAGRPRDAPRYTRVPDHAARRSKRRSAALDRVKARHRGDGQRDGAQHKAARHQGVEEVPGKGGGGGCVCLCLSRVWCVCVRVCARACCVCVRVFVARCAGVCVCVCVCVCVRACACASVCVLLTLYACQHVRAWHVCECTRAPGATARRGARRRATPRSQDPGPRSAAPVPLRHRPPPHSSQRRRPATLTAGRG